ncbi:DinB family protein [Apibacter adventoris]|uniref:DinB family protein n=1 Tax=Apibacter adventoris TaxID=1679466 RepID=UPI000CF70EB8|nr:DinB family protein [Apibacter adventoris]PQL93250.1 damage-inducible protein DinB [Apibacter adventoris]
MKKQFEILKACRKAIIETIDDLSLDQLQVVPKGFKCNIFWHMAHCLIGQQILHYKFSNLDLLITNDWVENYKKGTQTRFLINDDEVEFVKQKLIILVDQLEQDYEDKKFETYNEFTTSMGIVLNNIEDAINFNNLHEGIHCGIIKTMKNLIVNF